MGVSETAKLKITFVGGSGAGKTSLIFVITRGYFLDRFQPFLSHPPRALYVDFDPSSYQPACNRVVEMTETETGRPKDGKMLVEKRQTFQITCEDYDTRRVLSYIGAEVIALCFSVAKRETFDLIKTRVRRVYFT